ncbi:hypothetical protein [uncultured Ruegeria sp.]|uniref:hypothetical protein n=1 Tax=uncultured Ruegeria sp. TaxID=259304 RepID=UPI002612518D|nr:hypothetical protein [uncultured Ruegeria sp.]
MQERGADSAAWSSEEMPSGLGSFYLDSLNRSIRVDPSDWGNFAIPVLGLLSVAHRPLTIDELATISGLERYHVQMVVEIYRQFLNVDSGSSKREKQLRFFHASFPEFLQNEGLSGRCFLPATDQHLRIYERLEEALESGSWLDVSPYLVLHAIPHTLEAFGDKCEPFLEKIVSHDFLMARVAQDPHDLRLLQDLSTCIAMSRDRADVKATIEWASIRALILQSYIDQIHSDALTVLAASGEHQEAVRLLLVQMLDLGLDGSGSMESSRPDAFFRIWG